MTIGVSYTVIDLWLVHKIMQTYSEIKIWFISSLIRQMPFWFHLIRHTDESKYPSAFLCFKLILCYRKSKDLHKQQKCSTNLNFLKLMRLEILSPFFQNIWVEVLEMTVFMSELRLKSETKKPFIGRIESNLLKMWSNQDDFASSYRGLIKSIYSNTLMIVDLKSGYRIWLNASVTLL